MSNDKHRVGEFCWNELLTGNVEKASEFYCSLFGWETVEHDMGDMTYVVYKKGDEDIAGMMQVPSGQSDAIPPHWMSYITVEDLDEMIEKATSLGGNITMPKTLIGDFGQFAVVQDPTGAHVAIWQPLKSC